MEQSQPVIRYIGMACVVLVVSLILSFIVLFVLSDIGTHPERYLLDGVSKNELALYTQSALALFISITLMLGTYGFLMSRARASVSVWEATYSLAVSREEFRRLYDASPVPYLTLNESGQILSPNLAALRFFGRDASALEGKNLFEFVASNIQKKEELREYYRRQVPIDRVEVEIEAKTGEVRWIALSLFDMRSPAGSGRRGLATLFDITEQKKLDQAKTEFVSLASHQLRTPLATMKWQAEMLLSGDLGNLNQKQEEYVTNLHHANEDMIDLVNTLLNVSRIELGTFSIESVETNVGALVESVLKELGPAITDKNLHIEKLGGDALSSFTTDPKLLRIVIQNLVSNAVKYSKNDGVITIALEESGVGRALRVTDQGMGIPKDEQARVFSKLFRARNALTLPNTPGTGLGLYLVKSIAERLGGSISFTSEEGVGTTFVVTL